MAYRPDGFRPEDRMMNQEFARRIRSFLRREEWWDIVQKMKPLVNADQIWQTVIAGIDEMSDEDYQFAQSINWNAAADFDLSKISAYEYDNWWYTDLNGKEPQGTTLAVTGTVRLVNVVTDQEARKAARDFTLAHIDNDSITGFDTPSTKVMLGPKSAVTGKVLLR